MPTPSEDAMGQDINSGTPRYATTGDGQTTVGVVSVLPVVSALPVVSVARLT